MKQAEPMLNYLLKLKLKPTLSILPNRNIQYLTIRSTFLLKEIRYVLSYFSTASLGWPQIQAWIIRLGHTFFLHFSFSVSPTSHQNLWMYIQFEMMCMWLLSL